MMKRLTCLFLIVIMPACAGALISNAKQAGDKTRVESSHPQFERMKFLAGRWAEVDEEGKLAERMAEYGLAAGGNAWVDR